MMGDDLREMILEDPKISARASIVAWGARPQGSALPAITLNRISDRPIYVMEGRVGLSATVVQADCWTDTTYASACALGMALEELLGGFRGTHGTTRFHGIFSEGARDLRDAGSAISSGDADRFFRVSIDFNINHSEV